jgi:hypothetical protein
MKIIPQGNFLWIAEHDVADSSSLLVASGNDSNFDVWKVISMGKDVDTNYVLPGDLVLAQKKDINIARVKGETFYYIDSAFVIKLEE